MKIVILFCVLASTQAETNWANVEERKLAVDVRLFPLPPLSSKPNQEVQEKDSRVVGGQEAEPHQFPFQAGLLLTLADGRQAFCGGSLISQNFVLTAAHCTDGVKSAEVILGAHKIREEERTQIRIKSSEFIVHENWNMLWMRNDIALIKLPEPVQLNDHVQIIELPPKTETENFMDEEATVSGWGRTSDSSTSTSSILMYTNDRIISNVKCFLSYPLIIHSSHVCMDGRNGKSSCNGDSGGPLTIDKNGKPQLIGLVSFGRTDGCEKGHPGVYTRITSFYDWIESKLHDGN